jgi:hypothetical protein
MNTLEQKQEFVRHEFQDSQGNWQPFVDEQHYRNTVEAGHWPIRALYTEPPKWMRKWRNLSDGVMCDIAIKHGLMRIDWIDFARDIEAALKEKNA